MMRRKGGHAVVLPIGCFDAAVPLPAGADATRRVGGAPRRRCCRDFERPGKSGGTNRRFVKVLQLKDEQSHGDGQTDGADAAESTSESAKAWRSSARPLRGRVAQGGLGGGSKAGGEVGQGLATFSDHSNRPEIDVLKTPRRRPAADAGGAHSTDSAARARGLPVGGIHLEGKGR